MEQHMNLGDDMTPEELAEAAAEQRRAFTSVVHTVTLYPRWVCTVVASGFHNGAPCTPDEPHGGNWSCGWFYRLRTRASSSDSRLQVTYVEEAK